MPVVPRKRTVFVFDCEQSPQGSAAVNMGLLPLMVDSTVFTADLKVTFYKRLHSKRRFRR